MHFQSAMPPAWERSDAPVDFSEIQITLSTFHSLVQPHVHISMWVFFHSDSLILSINAHALIHSTPCWSGMTLVRSSLKSRWIPDAGQALCHSWASVYDAGSAMAKCCMATVYRFAKTRRRSNNCTSLLQSNISETVAACGCKAVVHPPGKPWVPS